MDIISQTICFAACGAAVLREISPFLAQQAAGLLSVRTDVASPVLELPPQAYNPQRGQYHAGIVLNHLADLYPPYLRVVGITSKDLFLPIFTHVYGEAQMPGRAALISTFRLDLPGPARPGERETALLRILKVTVHEILHTFELTHCHHSDCLMQPAAGVSQLDSIPLKLCRSCTNFWEDVRGRNLGI